jgi:hypothetical protein
MYLRTYNLDINKEEEWGATIADNKKLTGGKEEQKKNCLKLLLWSSSILRVYENHYISEIASISAFR